MNNDPRFCSAGRDLIDPTDPRWNYVCTEPAAEMLNDADSVRGYPVCTMHFTIGMAEMEVDPASICSAGRFILHPELKNWQHPCPTEATEVLMIQQTAYPICCGHMNILAEVLGPSLGFGPGPAGPAQE